MCKDRFINIHDPCIFPQKVTKKWNPFEIYNRKITRNILTKESFTNMEKLSYFHVHTQRP